MKTQFQIFRFTWISFLCLLAPLSFAQETEKDEKEKKDETMIIEEVTVTATKRATKVQDTPLAITALSQDALDKNQIKSLMDMVTLVPALQIAPHGDSNALDVTLRGVGSTNRTELGDPTVAFHVNDVYSPRPQGAAVLMYDVERVEVQRGPQGTLSGRNATVGSVSIHTAKPKFDKSGGNLGLTAGDYSRQAMKLAYNHVISDRFAIRIAGYTDRHDGYVDTLPNYVGYYPNLDPANLDEFQYSPQTGIKNYEAADQSSYRISALWNINETTTWFTTYEFYKDAGTGWVDEDPYLVNRGVRGVVVDSPGSVDMTNQSITSRLDKSFSAVDFSYILGLGNQKRSQVWDADLGRGDAFQEDRTEWSDYDFMSHELQLKNADDSRFRWVVGLYSSSEKNAIRFDIDHVANGGSDGNWVPGGWSWIDGGNGGGATFRQPDRQLHSEAIFAQSTFDITDTTRFTAGVRYISDEKSDKGGRSINCAPFIRAPRTADSLGGEIPGNDEVYSDANITNGASDNGTNEGMPEGTDCWTRQVNDTKAEWDKTTWLLRYEHDFSNDSMFYGSVGTGFKSGIIQDAGLEAEPEFITNTEIGLKTTLLDNRLQMNLALYTMDYENLQVSRPLLQDLNGDGTPDAQGSLFTVNAAEATINGFEMEMEALVGGSGRLHLITTLMDATYDEFDRDEPLFGQDNPWNPRSEGALGDIGFVNLAGNKLIRAPDYEITLAYEHLFILGNGVLVPRANITFTDDTFLDEFNRTDITGDGGSNIDISVQPAYNEYNLGMRYTDSKSGWSLDAFVQNAGDEAIRTAVGGFLGPEGLSSYYKPQRTYGVSIGYDW